MSWQNHESVHQPDDSLCITTVINVIIVVTVVVFSE